MKVIREKYWTYKLYETDKAELLFSVVCGTSVQYNLKIFLNEDEKRAFAKEDSVFLEKLAEDIRTNQDRYAFRTRDELET